MTEALIGKLGYLGIALILILGGLGLPVPEEAPIILAAVLSKNERMWWPLALASCFLGVLIGDFLVYFLGHLTPIMTEVTQRGNRLVYFVSQMFETVLPGLDNFDVSAAIVRDLPLDPVMYSVYTANVAIYALIYTAVALLVGLVLFEDRDVA